MFTVNGRTWRVYFVPGDDPVLVDRTGTYRVATTDPVTNCIYLSNSLGGDFLRHVLMHELGHVFMISYGVLNQLHGMTIPRYWIDIEEWICNLIADNATDINNVINNLMGGE